jgi:hypothetical protein
VKGALGHVDGEGMMGTILVLASIGILALSFAEGQQLLGIISIAVAFPFGFVITWDDWFNKQELMNRFFRRIGRIVGRID